MDEGEVALRHKAPAAIAPGATVRGHAVGISQEGRRGMLSARGWRGQRKGKKGIRRCKPSQEALCSKHTGKRACISAYMCAQ